MKGSLTIITILFLATSSFAADISELDVKAFLEKWLSAQNTGSYSNCAAMYSNSFTGIRKSGSRTFSLNHDAWLKERKRMFKTKMDVTANNQVILISGTTASVEQKNQQPSTANKRDHADRTNRCGNNKMTLKSRFTSIKEENCTAKFSKNISAYFDKKGTSAVRCPSLKNWQPYLVSTNERSWIELVYGHSIWTTEWKVVYESIGHFPNVGADYIEWRTTKAGNPKAIIFRIIAQDSNNDGHISGFFVISLTQHVPSFCGVAKTNEEARVIADNLASCTEMLPKKQLNL